MVTYFNFSFMNIFGGIQIMFIYYKFILKYAACRHLMDISKYLAKDLRLSITDHDNRKISDEDPTCVFLRPNVYYAVSGK